MTSAELTALMAQWIAEWEREPPAARPGLARWLAVRTLTLAAFGLE